MTDEQLTALRERIDELEDALEPLARMPAKRLHEAVQFFRLALAPRADAWRLWQMAVDRALVLVDAALDDEDHDAVGRLWYLCLALAAALGDAPAGVGDFAESLELHDEIARGSASDEEPAPKN